VNKEKIDIKKTRFEL